MKSAMQCLPFVEGPGDTAGLLNEGWFGAKEVGILVDAWYPTPFIEVTGKTQSNTPAYIIPVQYNTVIFMCA